MNSSIVTGPDLSPSPHQLFMLKAAACLARVHPTGIYGGTVDEKTIARRRKAGKVARKSRRANRGG